MTQQISDREVRLLASIAATLEADYALDEDDLWAASPFGLDSLPAIQDKGEDW